MSEMENGPDDETLEQETACWLSHRTSHAWIDERNRVLSAAVAQRLREHPEIIAAVLDRLHVRMANDRANDQGGSRWADQQWETMLVTALGSDADREALLAFMVANGDHATRLRQSTPFAGVLPEDERLAILDAMDALAVRVQTPAVGTSYESQLITNFALASGADVRERLSEPALRTVQRLSDVWQLSAEDSRELFGFSSSQGSPAGESPPVAVCVISGDQLMRVSLLLGIYEGLQRIWRHAPHESDMWIRRPRVDGPFRGVSPLDYMRGGISAIIDTRTYVDGITGGPLRDD